MAQDDKLVTTIGEVIKEQRKDGRPVVLTQKAQRARTKEENAVVCS